MLDARLVNYLIVLRIPLKLLWCSLHIVNPEESFSTLGLNYYYHDIVTILNSLRYRTIPFAWNLITSGYFELSVYGVWFYVFPLVQLVPIQSWFFIYSTWINEWLFAMLQVVFSTVSLLFMGKFLEPVWGSKEFLKFIFVVNFLAYLCVFVTAIALYYITRLEIYL